MRLRLAPTVDSGQFLLDLSRSRRRVVMLDYDGTLAPFVVDRSRAFAYPGVYPALNAMLRHPDVRLVIVTGRSLADIKPLLLLDNLPEIIGSHGWEKRDAQGVESVDVPRQFARILDSADFAAQTAGYGDGLERKPFSTALHWRGAAPELAAKMQARVGALWVEIARHNQVNMTLFDGGMELRIPGKDKGTAVAEILASEGPDVFAVYLGDDMTDEDAFTVVRDRGYGILVRQVFRKTKAQLWTRPPEGLLALLDVLSL